MITDIEFDEIIEYEAKIISEDYIKQKQEKTT